MIEMLRFALAMAAVCNTPADVALATWTMAPTRADAIESAGYLCSEHSGGGWRPNPDGPFNLNSMWERRYTSGGDRTDTVTAASIWYELVVYSRERHAECGGGCVRYCGLALGCWTACGIHDWRAHPKCAPGERYDCSFKVERWKKAQDRIKNQLGWP